MKRAIQTKVLPQTEKLPKRYKAWCQAGQLTMSENAIWESYHTSEQFSNRDFHRLIAQKLALKLGWYEQIHSGFLPNEDGCHVFEERK